MNILLKWLYSKYLPYIIAAAVVIAFLAYLYVQGTRVTFLKSNLAKEKMSLENCQEANRVNNQTIMSLKSEKQKASDNCSSRLKTKETLLKRIQKIDAIKTTGNQSEKSDSTAPDPLLGELNSMFPHKADNQD